MKQRFLTLIAAPKRALREGKQLDYVATVRPVEDIERIGVDFLDASDQARADVRLSADGRADRLKELRAEARAKKEKLVGPLILGAQANRASCLATMRAEVTEHPPADPGARLAWELARDRQVRQLLDAARGLDAIGRELLVRQLGTRALGVLDGLTVIDSHGGLPRVQPFVDLAVTDELTLAAAKAKRPELAERLHDVDLVEGAYRAASVALDRLLDEPVSLEAPRRQPDTAEPSIRVL